MTSTEPVTVVVARAVTGGREDDFHRWTRLLTATAEQFPGFLGWGLLRSDPGSTIWHVVYRFDTAAHLETWERSAARADLLARGAMFATTIAERRLDGVHAWFQATPRPGSPPRWKAFVLTATAILALQTVVAALLHPLIADWPTFPRTAVVILPVIALMTWVVMPQLARRLHRWLNEP